MIKILRDKLTQPITENVEKTLAFKIVDNQ